MNGFIFLSTTFPVLISVMYMETAGLFLSTIIGFSLALSQFSGIKLPTSNCCLNCSKITSPSEFKICNFLVGIIVIVLLLMIRQDICVN